MSAINKLTDATAQVGGLQAKGNIKGKQVQINSSDFIDKVLIGSVSVNPTSIATVTRGSIAVTITGAVVGDFIGFNPPAALEAGLLFVGAYISNADEATIMLYNPTGGAVDGAARNWTYFLISEGS